ncbi:GPI transamidase component PIG-S [Anoplophora glabripennis]|nr:GPI transamidase component PIG-S [Anoplophora glabripennis]
MTSKELTNKITNAANAGDEKESGYRVYSILSYFFILVIVGLPVWWYTTRVYRANLPISEMYEVELKNKSNKAFGIPLSLDYDILITFVHPDPSGIEIELNGEDIDKNMQPFLKAISPIADFVVKSQWLYLTDLGINPRKMSDHFALQESQLPHIISPLETKMWSHLSQRPTINLVLYFSYCSTPLYIYSDRNIKIPTNAFLSPRWGGIYIVNPDKSSCETKQFKPDLRLIVSTFITQIQHLFGVEGIEADNINKLKIRKTEEMIDSTRRTLKSLAQLLSEIGSIVISDEVGEKINIAVGNADLAEKFLQKGDVDLALKHSKIAFWNSEGAFSDPSLLALLYFPHDQKYAVYIPLFLPIMIPVFMSLTLVKKWHSNRKTQKTKSE